MRFWDASAITPLIVDEPWSAPAGEAVREDEAMIVWWGTRVECTSAVRRRERAEGLESAAALQALDLLDLLASSWMEVLPSEAIRPAAERALAVHPLRAADALQLAAAITWRQNLVRRAQLVCFDERLRAAASREGFEVLPKELG